MNIEDTMLPIGIIKIEEIDKLSDQVAGRYEEKNTITAEGLDNIMKNISEKGGNISSNYVISTIVLGDDVGNGSATSPEPPSILSTYLDQFPVVSVDESDVVKTYPATGQLSLGVLLDGESIVNSAGVETIDYTSATIRFRDDKCLSYKRFPVRTISRLINIRITWTISFSQ